MDRLEFLCSLNVCDNLSLNLNVLKERKLKIPLKIGNILFDIYSKQNKDIHEKELEIFTEKKS